MNWARALRRVVPPAFRRIDADMLEELEERLITADFGVQASMRFVDLIEKAARRGAARDEAGLRTILRDAIRAVFDGDGAVAPEQVDEAGSADAGSRDAGVPDATACLAVADTPPTVYLVVGVNGVGKTTTTGKLAHLLAASGRSVMLAAADTFRAGAVEQLERWAERAGADFIRDSLVATRPRSPSTRSPQPAPAAPTLCSSTQRDASTPTAASWSSSPRSTA